MADETINPLWYPVIVLAYGTYRLTIAGIAANRRWRLRRAQPTQICEVKQGQAVVIAGTVARAHQTLSAPISGRPCVAFSVAVPGLTGMEETVLVDFDVEDASGSAVIHAAGAQVFFKSADPQRREFGPYDDAGEWLGRWPGSYQRPVSIVERALLSIGDPIAVFGRADWRSDGSQLAHYREAPLRLHLDKPERSRVLVRQGSA